MDRLRSVDWIASRLLGHRERGEIQLTPRVGGWVRAAAGAAAGPELRGVLLSEQGAQIGAWVAQVGPDGRMSIRADPPACASWRLEAAIGRVERRVAAAIWDRDLAGAERWLAAAERLVALRQD